MALTLDFQRSSVLVIGGTSGINRGIAEAFAEHGAQVSVCSRKQEKVDDTVRRLEELGSEAYGFVADVRKYDELAHGVAAAAARQGAFDTVVSGAAGNFPALVDQLSPNGFKTVVEIDLLGTYHAMKAISPHLRSPGASVINISAPQAFIPMAGQIHVCAAKAGVDMITRTLALEWGPRGIRINSVVPGPIDGTEGMARLAGTPEMKQAAQDGVPLGRLGVPADIARACLFLASDLAGYVSGAVLPVDGGWAQNGCGDLSSTFAKLLG